MNLENEENKLTEAPKKSKKKAIIITIIVVVILSLSGVAYFIFGKDIFTKKDKSENVNSAKIEQKISPYRINSNALEMFDLRFLQLENEGKNTVYSPLSIKAALSMLNEGTEGNSNEQIKSIIGDYAPKKYENSNNMSFANALFVQEDYKKNINASYISVLTNKFGAEVIYDSFKTPTTLNNWVGNKTFGLINDLFEDVSDNTFILVNSLAIDMEWVNKIQSEYDDYVVHFEHEKFYSYVDGLASTGYHTLEFDNNQNVKSAKIGSVANKYDIVNELGESNIRETVGKAYSEWLKKDECGTAATEPDVNTYLDQYIKDINANFKHVSSSTDFYFYDDENVKVFSKDLKKYNGTTLQYIGIMPKNEELKDYVSNIDEKKINTIIDSLKEIKLDSFKDGVVTEINGYIPMFKFAYELKLMDDLKSMGVKDVFSSSTANLTKLTTDKSAYIDSAMHKANIEFSNDGIKASAATSVGGKGSANCSFDYQYEVPVEKIDLTFNKPYIFFIRDKDSQEVWFTGSVYEPVEWSDSMNY